MRKNGRTVSRKRNFRRLGTHCSLSSLVYFLYSTESAVRMLCVHDLKEEMPFLLVSHIKPQNLDKEVNYVNKSPNGTEYAVILPQLLLKNQKTSLIKMKLRCTWHL